MTMIMQILLILDYYNNSDIFDDVLATPDIFSKVVLGEREVQAVPAAAAREAGCGVQQSDGYSRSRPTGSKLAERSC